MADSFVAEIRIFPFNFAPTGWAFCNGQLLPLSQNTALFSLVGTFYGGDGKSNFALPNLQGSAPLMQGQGPGLSLYDVGQSGGVQTVTLLQNNLPSHSHNVEAASSSGQAGPANNAWGSAAFGRPPLYATPANLVSMSASALASSGGNLPHNNLMPYLTLNFCIALQGVYPARS